MENTINVGTTVQKNKIKKESSNILLKLKSTLNNVVDSFLIKVGLKQIKQEKNNIICDIEEIQNEIFLEKQRFNFEQDENMIDSHIYHIQGLEKKLNCIIKKAKEQKLVCNIEQREYCKRA